MNKVVKIVLIIVGLFLAYLVLTPSGTALFNTYRHAMHVTDDNTNYETLKDVENTCRAMIASYESDRLIYEQYKDSDNAEQRNWAEQAKMRANNTAVTYNNYILKNSYVWKNSVPADIRTSLEIIP